MWVPNHHDVKTGREEKDKGGIIRNDKGACHQAACHLSLPELDPVLLDYMFIAKGTTR